MESPLKQRLIGAAVLAALAIIFLPMLLKGPDVKEPDAAQVPLAMPNAPDQAFSTHELPLGPDTHTPPGGVLGMDTVPKPDANALPATTATVVNPTTNDVYPAVTPVPAPTAAPLPAATPVPAGPAAPVATNAGPTAPAPTTAKPATAPVAPSPTATPATTPATTTSPAATAPATTPALAPDAAPPAVKASAVAAGNYAVNVGSFSNLGNANALVTRLKAAGLPVQSEKVKLNGSDALRVRIGPYADRTAAEAARLRAESMAGGSGKVIALDGTGSLPAPPAKVATASKPTSVPTSPATPNSATPTSKPATAVTSGFAVQLAAPAEESAANALRDRARAAGFAAFVQRVDTVEGTRFRVRAGPVADHNAAEVLRDAVSQKLGISGNIVAHP